MKRVIAIVLASVLLIGASASMSFGASDSFRYRINKVGNGYVTKFYSGNKCIGKIRTNRKLAVKFIKSEKLTAKRLESRKGKYIVVEIIEGKCVDGKGNGRTSDGHYISYKGVNGYKRNARYKTYCVYGNNDSIDDIVIRTDFRIK